MTGNVLDEHCSSQARWRQALHGDRLTRPNRPPLDPGGATSCVLAWRSAQKIALFCAALDLGFKLALHLRQRKSLCLRVKLGLVHLGTVLIGHVTPKNLNQTLG